MLNREREHKDEVAPRRGLLKQAAIFLVGVTAAQIVGMVFVARLVAADPQGFVDWPPATRMLCGSGAKLGVDFERLPDGQRRPIDGWILCQDIMGTVIQPDSRVAAWIAGLPISVPLLAPLAWLVFFRRPR
jgi:hypothetical protein